VKAVAASTATPPTESLTPPVSSKIVVQEKISKTTPEEPKRKHYRRDCSELIKLPEKPKKWTSKPPTYNTKYSHSSADQARRGLAGRDKPRDRESKTYQNKRRKHNNRWNQRLRKHKIHLKETEDKDVHPKVTTIQSTRRSGRTSQSPRGGGYGRTQSSVSLTHII